MCWKTAVSLKESHHSIGHADFDKIHWAHIFRTEIQKTDANTAEVIFVSPMKLVVIKKNEQRVVDLYSIIVRLLTRALNIFVAYKRQSRLRQL